MSSINSYVIYCNLKLLNFCLVLGSDRGLCVPCQWDATKRHPLAPACAASAVSYSGRLVPKGDLGMEEVNRLRSWRVNLEMWGADQEQTGSEWRAHGVQTLVVWGGSRGPPHCLCFGFGCDLFVMLGWSAAPEPRTYMLGRCCT